MSRDWLAYFKAKRNMGAVICEGPEIEAACLGLDRLHSDYAALLARHNALRDAVAWERECGTVSFTDLWFDEWNRTEDQSHSAMRELRFTRRAARAEVDRLIANETADCKGEE